MTKILKTNEDIKEFILTNQPNKTQIKKIKKLIKSLDLKGVFSQEEIKCYTNSFLIFGKDKTKNELKEHFVLKNLLNKI